jgi:hypothetical protein
MTARVTQKHSIVSKEVRLFPASTRNIKGF